MYLYGISLTSLEEELDSLTSPDMGVNEDELDELDSLTSPDMGVNEDDEDDDELDELDELDEDDDELSVGLNS
jgi:hypothetical protein